jgi:hypothetical protein
LDTKNHKPVVYYLCQFGYWDAVKIGTTINLPKRFRKYQTQKPNIEWHILAIEESDDNAFHLEGIRQNQFIKSRISGEWFWNTPDLSAHISSLPDLVEKYLL